MNDRKGQNMFERCRQKNTCNFMISQDYYQLPKKRFRANCIINHVFKPTNFRDVQNLHQDKSSIDVSFIEIKIFFSTSHVEMTNINHSLSM